MSNMSHCRFENTFRDLSDCYDAICEYDDMKVFIEDCNQCEKLYVNRLIALCKDIAHDFGD